MAHLVNTSGWKCETGRLCAALTAFLYVSFLYAGMAAGQAPAPAPETRPVAEGLAFLAADDPALQSEGRMILQAHVGAASTPEARGELAGALLDFAAASPLAIAAEIPEFEPGLVPWLETIAAEAQEALTVKTATEAQIAARRDAARWAGYLADASLAPRFEGLLGDPDVWMEAVNALLDTPEGIAALLARIPQETSSDKQIEYLRAIGQAQIREAKPLLEKLAKESENHAIAWAAIDALSLIGVPPNAVMQRPGNVTKEEAARYANAGLRAAQELLDHGQADKAASLFRVYVDASGSWSQIQAALTGLNAAGSVEAVRSALGYLGTPHLRAAAKRILIESTAPGTDTMLDKAAKVGDPAMQSAILEIYAERGGKEGQAKIEAAVNGATAEVRVTAARLLGKVPNDADLIDIATSGTPWARTAAVNTFLDSANARLLTGDHAAAAQQFRALLQIRPGVDAENAAIEGLGQCGDYGDQDLLGIFMGDPETGPAAYAAKARLTMKAGDRNQVVSELETIAEVSPYEAGIFAAAEGLAHLGLPEPKYNKQRGFLTDWIALGPFPNENNKAYGLSYITESRGDALQLVTWLGQQYRWEKIPAEGYPPVVNLGTFYKDADKHAGYVFSKFSMSKPMAADLNLGVGGAYELWFNGERVAGEDAFKGFRIDEIRVPVTLHVGINKVLLKVIQSPQDWRCAVRITDRRGRPVDLQAQRPAKDGSEGVGVSADRAASTVNQAIP